MNETKQLLHYSTPKSAIPASAALADYRKVTSAQLVCGLLYTPRRCRLCRLDAEGRPTDEHVPAREIGLGDVYELRAFCEAAELRWRHESAGLGRAVILAEDLSSPPADWEPQPESKPYLGEPHPLTYLVWGTPAATDARAPGPRLAAGWSRLREGRIGELAVPVEGVHAEGQRVVLHAREYFAEGDEDGNVTVLDERLLSLTAR